MEPLLGQWISKRYALITVSLGDLCLCSMYFGFYLLAPVHLALYTVRLKQGAISSQCSGHSLHLPQVMQMLRKVQYMNHSELGVLNLNRIFSRATHESREIAGMKRCYICGAWTRNPIRSSTHRDCPHSACRLNCLLKMEMDHVDRIFEMGEMDESLRTQSRASANSSDSVATHNRSNARSRSPRRD